MVLREPLGLKAELPRMNAGAPAIIWDKSEARKVPLPVADSLPIGRGFCPGIVTGLAYGGVFPSCQNCFIKRTHWAHPSQVVISALRRRPGAQECCGQA
jgi:hypothetical protein